MRVLVIDAHPLADSCATALHRTVQGALRRGGHQVDDCDLYAEGFDPVLTPAERRAYNLPEPDLSVVADHVARLKAADALVLCIPTWWYGMPAILEGYFDGSGRTGSPSRCRHPPGVDQHQAAMGGDDLRRAVVADPADAARPGAQGDLGRPLYNVDGATPARVAAFLARVERALVRF